MLVITRWYQDQMLEALAAWDHLEPLLHFASEMHGSLPSGHLERTVRLREARWQGW